MHGRFKIVLSTAVAPDHPSPPGRVYAAASGHSKIIKSRHNQDDRAAAVPRPGPRHP